METNLKTSTKKEKKVAVISKAGLADPFAEAVTETPVKKTVAKKAAVKPKAAAAVAEPAKPTVKRSVKAISADPFAEVAEATSPVKKAAARTTKAKAAKATTTVKKTTKKAIKKTPTLDVSAEIAAAEPKVELSPAFVALAEPKLPELKRENRARLQMQTPTRLYFYWSVKNNPWAMLRNVFGDDLGSYSLVLKLIDNKTGFEEIHQTDAEGNFWFNVEPNGSYMAEIGFYAPNRPYFRILHSNTVETPRRSPSPRPASDAKWTVSANKFAEVLDVAGFSRDAFDVAIAGDDQAVAEDASQLAFSSMLGGKTAGLDGISAEDIRYAMIALASGATLEDLRWKVSEALFAILQANAGKLGRSQAMGALTEYFDIDETEFTEEQFGPAVFGASLVNFPRTLKTRNVTAKYSPRYDPVSSHSIR